MSYVDICLKVIFCCTVSSLYCIYFRNQELQNKIDKLKEQLVQTDVQHRTKTSVADQDKYTLYVLP